jgi:NADH-quinone oxidoreductase subunit A
MTATMTNHMSMLAQEGTDLVQGMGLFVLAGAGLALGGLLFGRLLRPHLPHPVKIEPYECGEPVIGSSWVQFDLRFYVVALVFLIFDVEIALFYPWAVVFGGGAHAGEPAPVLEQVRVAALFDLLFFFGVLVVGFVYLWRFGYLNWVRAVGGSGATAQARRSGPAWESPPAPRGAFEKARELG